MIVSLRVPAGNVPLEDDGVRAELDATLARLNKVSTTENAELLFPWRSWRRHAQDGPEKFYDWYLKKMYPRLKACSTNNKFGTYFQRMIDYPTSTKPMNQLNHILELWNERQQQGVRPRESALEIAIFSPGADHTKAVMRGFPCLQQVSLSYASHRNELALTALYPCQYVLDRGYGNYLGLCSLGRFLGEAMGLSFVRLTCVVVKPQLGHKCKQDLRSLHEKVQQFVATRQAAA